MAGKIICYVLVGTEVGREHEVASSIKRTFEGKVSEVIVTYGLYDVVVRIETDDLKVVDSVVTGIRGLPGVKQTVTLIGA